MDVRQHFSHVSLVFLAMTSKLRALGTSVVLALMAFQVMAKTASVSQSKLHLMRKFLGLILSILISVDRVQATDYTRLKCSLCIFFNIQTLMSAWQTPNYALKNVSTHSQGMSVAASMATNGTLSPGHAWVRLMICTIAEL